VLRTHKLCRGGSRADRIITLLTLVSG
jgi:hypothetical protein